MSNMLTSIVFDGRAARDPELTVNPETGAKYVRLNFIQNKGYSKEKEHSISFSCFFYGNTAERLINAKVKKGSVITIIGNFDSKEYMRTSRENPNEQIHDRSLEVSVYDWQYPPQNKPKDDQSGYPAQSNAQGQAAQGTQPAQNYPPAQNAAPAQNYQQAPNQAAQQPNYGNAQGTPAPGYQQQYQQSPPPAGAAYNPNYASGFNGVAQEPLPFHS